jgi:hypothetical protein
MRAGEVDFVVVVVVVVWVSPTGGVLGGGGVLDGVCCAIANVEKTLNAKTAIR